jgi:hypothetical protein
MINPCSGPLSPAAAAEVAVDALIWLAGQPDAFGRFLAETGIDPAALRALAQDPDGLGFVLDFLLRDEALLVAFADASGLDPAVPGRARRGLPGGDAPSWT